MNYSDFLCRLKNAVRASNKSYQLPYKKKYLTFLTALHNAGLIELQDLTVQKNSLTVQLANHKIANIQIKGTGGHYRYSKIMRQLRERSRHYEIFFYSVTGRAIITHKELIEHSHKQGGMFLTKILRK